LVTTVSYGILIVVVAVVAAVAGLVLAQRLIPLSLREQNNTATGTIYAALYVVFGVSLGFSLFLVWQQFNTARQTAENEATSLQQVHNLAARFPGSEQDRVKELAVSYARVVVEEEWGSLEQGRPSERAESLLDQLRQSVVVDLDPRSDAQDALYAASVQEVDDLEENRALRLLAAREGIPPILWVVLVVGGTLTIAFTYLFGIEKAWLHAVAVAGLAMAVCLILYVIAVLDYPFSGGVSVQPDAFELVLREIEGNNES
jgi:ABC-type multidrug transport system fused ATPase/permease subunit